MSGGITKISPQMMIAELTNWNIEINSPYNDGWTVQHYQKQLDEMIAYFDRLKMTDEEKDFEDEKSKWVCEECGKTTIETDFDYLVSPTMHLGCQLQMEKEVDEILEDNA